jgi:SPP1 gp7 family putative phage head morphogenesis protein
LGVSESDWAANGIEDVVPIDLGVHTPDPNVLKTLVSKETVNGKFVKDWYKDWGRGMTDKITRQVRIGVGLGEGYDKIAKRIIGKSGVLGEQERHIKTLVRTTIANVSNKARQSVYENNEDVVKGVEIVATLDSRTSAICRSEDGNVYPVDSGPRPPFHPNCRTTTIPVLKSWKELGIDLKEAPPGTRASMDGQVSSKQSYGQWLKKQSKSVQEEVLGKRRAALFRSGKVKIDKFVDPRGRSLTLAELDQVQSRDAIKASGLNAAERTTEIKKLLKDLEGATDKKSKSRIRRHLRKLGHTGGAKTAPPTKVPKATSEVSISEKLHGDPINPTYGRTAVAEFDRLKEKYPNTHCIGLIAKKIVGDSKDAIAVAGSRVRPYKLIELNTKYWSRKFDLKALAKDMHRRKWVTGKTIKEFVTHEYGHHISYSLSTKKWNIFQGFYNDLLLDGDLDDYAKMLGSQYAKTNPSELFAEMFVKYEQGKLSGKGLRVFQRIGVAPSITKKVAKVAPKVKVVPKPKPKPKVVVKKPRTPAQVTSYIDKQTKEFRKLEPQAMIKKARELGASKHLISSYKSSPSFWKTDMVNELGRLELRKNFGTYRAVDSKMAKKLMTWEDSASTASWQSQDWRTIRKGWGRTESAKAFETAIEQLPEFKGDIFRGGVLGEAGDVAKIKRFKQGSVLTMKAPLSASKKRSVATEFAGTKATRGRTPYIIKFKTKGMPDISTVSLPEYNYQKEVIVRAGSKWRIKKVVKQHGRLKDINDNTFTTDYFEVFVEEI